MVTLPFINRSDAGRQLAQKLIAYRGTDPLVLAIPRGGVPVAREIAEALRAELDVALVRHIAVPADPELAVGCIDERGKIVLNRDAERLGIDATQLGAEAEHQAATMRATRARYGGGCAAPPVTGRVVIVVDDGLATAGLMSAALRTIRCGQPARLICAVPVAASETLAQIDSLADETLCLATPTPFRAVSRYYLDFGAVSDEQVAATLVTSRSAHAASASSAAASAQVDPRQCAA